MKRNCWEAKKCGREPGGAHVADKGICPAATAHRMDGVHGGRNAGRSCWVVAGTICGGEVQGTFANKFHNCEKCDFYQGVYREEGAAFQYSSVLLKRNRS